MEFGEMLSPQGGITRAFERLKIYQSVFFIFSLGKTKPQPVQRACGTITGPPLPSDQMAGPLLWNRRAGLVLPSRRPSEISPLAEGRPSWRILIIFLKPWLRVKLIWVPEVCQSIRCRTDACRDLKTDGDGERTQQLRVLTALAMAPGSYPSSHTFGN